MPQAGIQVSNSGRDRGFSPFQNIQISPPSLILVGTGVLSQGLKWPGRDVDHSPPSDNAKHERRCTSPPTVCLHCAEIGKFTFTLLPETRKIWLNGASFLVKHERNWHRSVLRSVYLVTYRPVLQMVICTCEVG